MGDDIPRSPAVYLAIFRNVMFTTAAALRVER
jgi:hypothetical protein